MKSFEKYYFEIKDDFIFDTVRGMQKKFYEAGAEEKLKSLRCETCFHVMDNVDLCDNEIYCKKMNRREKMNHGCVHWSKK
jgi:hypothetical protein